MRDWLSAQDLADLGLPGLPATKQGWLDYAEREGWFAQKDKARARQGRGGGLEFHIDLLPPATLAAYVAKHVGAVDLKAECFSPLETSAANDAQLTLPAVESRDARLALLAAADRLAREGNMSRNLADRAFVALYHMEKIEVAPWVREACPKISTPTLWRWRRQKDVHGISRLGVDKGAARRGKGALESGEQGKVRAFLLAEITRQPNIAGRKLRNLVAAQFPTLAGISQRSVERMAARIKREDHVVITAMTNPGKFKGSYRLAGEKVAAHISRINELWEIDASPADVLLVDGRYSIYVCIDVFSRRMLVLVTKTPRAEAVGLLIRRTLIEWGVPERIKTDNGSDFRARFTQHLFNALEIEIDVCPPFTPEKKPHVERAIKTFQHDFCSSLPGFVGHSVADRKVIEERRAFAQRLGVDDRDAFKVELTADDFQLRADAWARDDYGTRPHSGIGCSPFERAAAFQGAVRKIDDPRALHVLLAPIAKGDGTRIVTKRGLRIDNRTYLTQLLPLTRVFVRMDPEDMGRAWLFSEDGAQFVGEAICPEVAGIDPAAAVMEMRAWQKRTLDEMIEPIRREAKKRSKRDIADILAQQAAERAGKLVAFPKREESYTTPGLEAAAEAAGIVQAPPALPISNQFVDEKTEVTPVHQLPQTPQMRWRRARDLEARRENNEQIGEEDAFWLGGYQTSIEYRAFKEIYDESEDGPRQSEA